MGISSEVSTTFNGSANKASISTEDKLWTDGLTWKAISELEQAEESATPSTPTSGKWKQYFTNIGMNLLGSDGVKRQVVSLEEGYSGASGSFTSAEGKIVTVTNGIITGIS